MWLKWAAGRIPNRPPEPLVISFLSVSWSPLREKYYIKQLRKAPDPTNMKFASSGILDHKVNSKGQKEVLVEYLGKYKCNKKN